MGPPPGAYVQGAVYALSHMRWAPGRGVTGPGTVVSQVPIPREHIYAIKEHLPVAEAATEYAGQLLRLDETVLPRNAEGAPALLLRCPPAELFLFACVLFLRHCPA